MLTNVQKLMKNSLLLKGWKPTNNESVLTKNSCYFYMDKKNTFTQSVPSFTYSPDEIQTVINASYDFKNADLFKIQKCPEDCDNPKTDYFLVKNGWVLVKGKYESSFSTLTEDDLRINTEFSSVQKFNSVIDEIDNAAHRDYIALRGIKQRCYKRTKKENTFKCVPNGQGIVEGCFVQIQNTSNACSLFKEGACFKILIISENGIIVSVVKNGIATNNNYELPADVVLNEALNKNMLAVDIVPDLVDVSYDSWESFCSEDIASNLPEKVLKLITSDEQKAAVMEAFSKHLNITMLLNDDISADAYKYILNMLEGNYVHPNMLCMRIRESIAKVLAHYQSIGLEPDRYFDDTFDQFALEECIQADMHDCNLYKEKLLRKNLSEDVVDFLYKYRFKYGKELDVVCNESTRWQFLLPYFFTDYLPSDVVEHFSNMIKMYASLTDEGCYLKIDFLDAASKGAILNYFKAPVNFDFLGKEYTEALNDLVNSLVRIAFDRTGISIKGDMYSLCRDINSLYVRTITNRKVWRCCFINEEAIISSDSNTELYF